MKERGYRRSPEQCKCKWKNLVNRYKGKETSDPDNGRQCPFFDELHAIFTERAKNMQRMLRESETGSNTQAKKKMKRAGGERSSEELSEEDIDEDDDSEEERSSLARSGKRKAHRERPLRSTTAAADRSKTNGIQEIIQDWFRQQQRMEVQWQEMMEKRARERQLFEQEWRQSMEKLERERLIMEQAWREREEQRRMREESRAEKRDTLLTTLLNRLIREDF